MVKARLRATLRPLKAAAAEGLRKLPLSSCTLGPPKGCYPKVDDYVKQRQAAGRDCTRLVLEPAERGTIAPPELTVGDHPDSGIQPLPYCAVQVRFYQLPRARIYCEPSAIVSPDDRVFADISQHHPGGRDRHMLLQEPWLHRCHDLPGRALHLKGGPNIYHWLIDTASIIVLCDRAGISLREFDWLVIFAPTTPFERELFALFDLPNDRIVDKYRYPHLRAEQLAFLSTTYPSRSLLALLRGSLVERGLLQVARSPERRLFVSRSRARTRRILNEAELYARLQREGFERVFLEDLSLREQMQAFAEASHVISPHGAGLTHLMFCAPGARVLEFRHAYHHYYLWNCYWRLSYLAGLRYFCFLTPEVRTQPVTAETDLAIDLAQFEQMLPAFLT